MEIYSVALLPLSCVLLFIGGGEGLNCWHCIADNCDLNPEDNYKAYKIECQAGQQCQKVLFKMKSDVKATEYMSTVRSCAEQCYDQDDFPNCSEWQYESRGCVRRSCCNDDDLCNGAHTTTPFSIVTLFSPFFSFFSSSSSSSSSSSYSILSLFPLSFSTIFSSTSCLMTASGLSLVLVSFMMSAVLSFVGEGFGGGFES